MCKMVKFSAKHLRNKAKKKNKVHSLYELRFCERNQQTDKIKHYNLYRSSFFFTLVQKNIFSELCLKEQVEIFHRGVRKR